MRESLGEKVVANRVEPKAEISRVLTPHPKAEAEPKFNALIIIEGDHGTGTGFIAKIKGRFFIVTNIHVISGNANLKMSLASGEEMKFGDICFIAKDRDIAIIPISYSQEYYEVVTYFDEIPMGQRVAVFGNSQGSSVITNIEGQILGVGADSIEVSAEFVPGNSGSPVVIPESDKVIGVASFIQDNETNASKWERNTEFERMRRFAYRVDNIEEWDRLTFDDLFEYGKIVRDYQSATDNFILMTKALMQERQLPAFTGLSDRMKREIEKFFRDYNPSRGDGHINNKAMQSFKDGISNLLATEKAQALKELDHNYFRNEIEGSDHQRQRATEFLNQFRL